MCNESSSIYTQITMESRVYSPDWSSSPTSEASDPEAPSPIRPLSTPNVPSTPPPLLRRRRQNTSRDDRLRVHTLREIGWNSRDITRHTGLTQNQVRYALTHPSTPRKPSGRPSQLSPNDIDRIIEWVCASKANRRSRWDQIPQKLGLNVGYYTVRRALRNAGFERRLARRKPPISERNRQARLAFAIECVDWTPEQWNNVLWTDETWATGGRHTRTWVTRRRGEEWDPTCINERHQRRAGWMFWGSFAGKTKGPAVFWEKDWGNITSESYREHVVPLIDGWIRLRRQHNWAEELILMQDNAPCHTAQATLQDFAERRIRFIRWPAFSPDLNPIETVWNWMKDWIDTNYEEEDLISNDAIRRAILEAWDAVPEQVLKDLIKEMPARCQAVIDADGMHTRY
jgi:transposase